jgi:hypothetical protein
MFGGGFPGSMNDDVLNAQVRGKSMSPGLKMFTSLEFFFSINSPSTMSREKSLLKKSKTAPNLVFLLAIILKLFVCMERQSN